MMKNPKYTEEQINKAMNNAKTSIEIEGLKVRKGYEELVRKRLSGEISQVDFLEQVKKLAMNS